MTKNIATPFPNVNGESTVFRQYVQSDAAAAGKIQHGKTVFLPVFQCCL